ncbi:MAG: hypothetical protein HY811_10870 [Planctomycetes bacterium]|nr:hypothetical protein [Planctomycetota bacterium]
MKNGKWVTGVLIGIALGAILTGSLGKVIGAPEKDTEYKCGRFQIFQGTVNLNNEVDKKIEPIPLVFLLDSCTGEVKYYYMMLSKNDMMVGEWLPTRYNIQMVRPSTSPIPVPASK